MAIASLPTLWFVRVEVLASELLQDEQAATGVGVVLSLVAHSHSITPLVAIGLPWGQSAVPGPSYWLHSMSALDSSGIVSTRVYRCLA